MTGSSHSSIEHLLRDLAPQVLGALARRHADFAAAEDAVQEALMAAAGQWPDAGIPDNPRGWLFTVAVRRLTDHTRSELARHRREERAATLMAAEAHAIPPDDLEFGAEQDDTLTLLFMSCHPALTPASAIALTLRAVGGLSTAEIARGFLVPEATMAQRISRAKVTIKSSGVPFRMPSGEELPARVASVLHVLYLIFNEGYTSSAGQDLTRVDLSREAIRLARMTHALLPESGEVEGLLALMLLTDARRVARTGPDGELIPLDEQDRSLWDGKLIAEGTALVSRALARGAAGPYQLQAAVAAVHDAAASAKETDWREIRALYEVQMKLGDNPMVRLNHAIAVAMVEGPAAGLTLLDELEADTRLAGHYRLDAVRGHLHERLGDPACARAHFLKAAEGTLSAPERDYLTWKAYST